MSGCQFSLRLSLPVGALRVLVLVGLAISSMAAEHPIFDLQAGFRLGQRVQAEHCEAAELSAGGERRPAIFLHAGAPGAPLATLRFPAVQLPPLGQSIDKLEFRFAIGFRDGETFKTAPGVDGAAFIVRVDGREVFRQRHAAQQWVEQVVDLGAFSGRQVVLELVVDPLTSPSADWCVWGQPVIWAVGEQPERGVAVPPHWPLAAAGDQPAGKRVIVNRAGLWQATLDEHLDLAVATDRRTKTVPPPVPLGPAIVAGQGAHPDNHTVVRVLNSYGVVASQFLAFPPAVRGGVQVEVCNGLIATAPIAGASVSSIRLFDREGRLQREVSLADHALKPPYQLAAGNFVPTTPGEELIVASAGVSDSPRLVVIGAKIAEFAIPWQGSGPFQLSLRSQEGGDQLVLHDPQRGYAMQFGFSNGVFGGNFSIPKLPPGARLFENADGDLVAAFDHPSESRLLVVKSASEVETLAVDGSEKRFWVALQDGYEKEFGELSGKDGATNVRICSYRHLRVDASSPRYRAPDAHETAFAGAPMLAPLLQRGVFRPLDQQGLHMWNPCFSHRQFARAFFPWSHVVDPKAKLPAHLVQSDQGRSDGYHHSHDQETKGFHLSSYATGNAQLQLLYERPLRTFLRQFAKRYRQHPELMPSIEPNHEFEVALASDGTVGDYNPHNVADFQRWLVRTYGAAPTWIERFQLPFTTHFDAPRGHGRGGWDRYDLGNPYFAAWVAFNRYVVNRTLALSYREALLAGIPPGKVHCHQIPDRYALQPLFKGVNRISPIDYAMTAGVGFGFTKFGVNHNHPHNPQRAARSSGFDDYVMGEFQPLTDDPQLADKELRFVFNNGARAIHVLHWGNQHRGKPDDVDEATQRQDEARNKTVYDAVQRLLLEDPPRPGQAGGVGQLRPFVAGDRRFDVVSIGTGPHRRGLLKSINADGNMEGTVYATPFRSHLRVSSLPVAATENAVSVRCPDEVLPGSQIEVRFQPVGERCELRIFRGESELVDLRSDLQVEPQQTAVCRLRIPARIDNLRLQLSNAAGVVATLQQPQIADVHRGAHRGNPHRGGVTFDLLPQQH